MKDQEIMAILKAQLLNCAGWEGDEISQDRQAALDYYFQRPRGDEVTGRSTAVAGDLSSMVESNLAQMLDAYSTENLAVFDAVGEEDEEQAALESDTVSQYVMKTQNGFMELASAVKNALLVRNGVAKCWVDRFEETATRTFDDVDPMVRDMVAPGAEVISYDEGSKKLRVRSRRLLKKFRFANVAPENFYYPKYWPTFDLQSCPGVFERHIDLRSDLVRMGFPKDRVRRLTPLAVNGRDLVGQSRNVGQTTQHNPKTSDPSLDLIEWFEGYVLLDVDGDGIAERRLVSFHYDDGEILEDEPEDLVPYGIGVVMLNPNRVTGISQYDKLRMVQDEHTGLKRALYDNVNTVTKNRTAVLEDKANIDDTLDGRTNGTIRVHGCDDVRQAVMAFTVPDNSPNILQNIEALKRERSELGGAALDMASGQMQIGGDRMGSQGLDRAYSVTERLAALMAKMFAETLIRSVWLVAHAVIRKNFAEPVALHRNGAWVSPNPSEWQPRDRLTVRPGMAPGELERLCGTYRTMLTDQIAMAEKGMDGQLVDATKFYRTLMTWARLRSVRNPEQFWIDPASPGAQAVAKQKGDAARADAAARQALMERAIGTQETQIGLDKYKHDSKLQYDYWKGVLDSDVAEAQIVGSATVDLLKQRESAKVVPIKQPVAPAKAGSK